MKISLTFEFDTLKLIDWPMFQDPMISDIIGDDINIPHPLSGSEYIDRYLPIELRDKLAWRIIVDHFPHINPLTQKEEIIEIKRYKLIRMTSEIDYVYLNENGFIEFHGEYFKPLLANLIEHNLIKFCKKDTEVHPDGKDK